MSTDEYDILKSRIKGNNKKLLETLYQEFYEINKDRIREGYRTDKEHNMYVNFCINCFQPDSELYNRTGYGFLYSDPFFDFIRARDGLKIKNFDIAIYQKNQKDCY